MRRDPRFRDDLELQHPGLRAACRPAPGRKSQHIVSVSAISVRAWLDARCQSVIRPDIFGAWASSVVEDVSRAARIDRVTPP